jgi:hypothetical protein
MINIIILLLPQVYNLPPPNEATLRDYDDLPLYTVPKSVQTAALIARNDEDVGVLARAFTGDREGYANNSQILNANEIMAAAQDFREAEDDNSEHLHDSILMILHNAIVNDFS